MQHSRQTLFFKQFILSAHFVSSPSVPSPHDLGCFSIPPTFSSPSPHSLRVFQWNAGGLRARSSTELLHFISSHPVDLICIHLGSSTLRSDRTHSRSGILSRDATHASGSVIFVRQGLSYSELSSLDPCSDYVGVNISLSDLSPLSFLNVYAPPICSLTDCRTDSFSPSRNRFILGDFNCYHPLWYSKGTSEPRGKEVFDRVIFSNLPLNVPDIPTLLRSSDISFAPSSLALLFLRGASRPGL